VDSPVADPDLCTGPYDRRVDITIRPARPDDLDQIEAVENAADALLIELFHPDRWEPAPSGAARAAMPGFLLVAQIHTGGPIGFVHVIEPDGVAHLEQLAVLPEYGRRGYGRMLVDAAIRTARDRGHDRLTLRTYADVPWNAPFYRTLGFHEENPSIPFHHDLIRTEMSLGLDRYGRRIQMGMNLLQGP
jgi:GNAT superfamily N-acetyltransferase